MNERVSIRIQDHRTIPETVAKEERDEKDVYIWTNVCMDGAPRQTAERNER